MRHITTNSTPSTALRAIADHSWHKRGLCHGMPAKDADKLFFPGPRAHKAIAQAKQLCGRCPVRGDCFNHALDNTIKEGIWGGLTETERRPWHTKINKRLDYTRVRAAFLGRDVHLSEPEREAVTRHAYVRGWSPERLAYTLQVGLDHARDLMRDAGHDVADRDRYWDLYDTKSTTDAEPTDDTEDTDEDGDTEQEEKPVSSPVTGHIQTKSLIAALRRAA
ncbi:WhiB family transcriptional regulator [Streptomyces sp. NPDC056244]|uniref:WhiB family transcriptional regulator n=1 Tax=Streptomyces sp. NPDC056244 TaxID=3345762 RepID=UPI0035DD31EB